KSKTQKEMMDDILRNLSCYREAGSSSSSGPQRLSQQSSQQPAEEESQQSSQQTGAEKIFQSDAVLTKEIGKRSKEELLALGIEVLRSRGQDWMREQLDRRDRDLVKKLAGKAGIQVKVQGRAKLRDVLVGELMELFASATAQSSEQTVEEAIFQSRVLLTNEIEKRSKDEVLALGAAVLHARGQDWMREKLSRVTTAELARKLAASAGIPIRVAGSLKPKDALVEELMELFASAGSSRSSGPRKSSQQSSQQTGAEESQQSAQQIGAEDIFKSDVLLGSEIGKRSKEEMLALGIEVLRSRGQDWMREQLDRRDRDLVKKLALKAGIQVNVGRYTKPKPELVEKLLQLFASVTLEAWEKLRGKDRILDKNALQQELDRHELQNLKLMACFAGIDRAAFDQKRSWMRDEFIQHLCAFLVSEVTRLQANARVNDETWLRSRLGEVGVYGLRTICTELNVTNRHGATDTILPLEQIIENLILHFHPPESKAQQLKQQALQQGNVARSWLSDALQRLSSRAGKGAAESDLAAVAREAGVEKIRGMKRHDLVRAIVDKLLPREVDAEAAVEKHACRLLSACIKMKDKGEEVDAAAIEQHLDSRELLLKLVAWLRMERLEVIQSHHRSKAELLSDVVEKVGGLLQGYGVVLDAITSADIDLDQLVSRNALIFPAGWRKLLDLSPGTHELDVAERLFDLHTVTLPKQWSEPIGFEDQEDMLQVLLELLRGRRSSKIVDGKEIRRRGALDSADKTLLRGMMRRYGWERAENAAAPCYWDEVYRKPSYEHFMWFLLQKMGVHQNVVEMFDQLKEWQDTTGLKVMPSEADDKGLCDKAENYRQKQAKMRSKVMAENYPVDFEPLHALSLDCFASSGNGMVMWRSEFEREMLFSLPGWVEDDRKKQTFHNLQEILRSKDEAALKHLETLRSNALTLQQKLEKVAVDLRCAPTMSSVQETLAHRFLQVPDESAEPSLEKYVCRLCDFHCQLSAQMEEHIRDCHAADGSDRAVVEYRKKVIGLLQHAGPKAPCWTMQRNLVMNADSALRCPGAGDGQREEGACVVCARKFWSHELFPVILYQDPTKQPEQPSAEEAEREVKRVAAEQQEKLCHLLGMRRYLQRWPHLRDQARAVEELRASAVEHPFLPGEFLLLHRRRMPADPKAPCDVCRECRTSLTGQFVSLPRYSLANDLWMGRQLPELRNLAAGTKRLLPMIRPCHQVTVLQPANLVREERQRGFIGNSIFLPQATPGTVCRTLPPREVDMQESILFVLVGHDRAALKSSALLQAPREEYERAVRCLQSTSLYYAKVELEHGEVDALQSCVLETESDSYLAQQLLQQGPADAQGQSEDQEMADADSAGATATCATPGDAEEPSSDRVIVQNTGRDGLFLRLLLHFVCSVLESAVSLLVV
ncbi:Transketolase, partial [Durusdinium trenchii]